MARVDAKTVGAVALISLVGLNYSRLPGPASPGAVPTIVTRQGADGEEPNDTSPVERDMKEEYAAEVRPYIELTGHTPRYLIATVPDPDGTTLRLYTDRTLDALMLAAFDNGFVLVHHWLPWRFSLERLDEHYTQRRNQVMELKERAKFPGLLVFEKDKDILIVYLVPETPTSGVNREVLQKAAENIACPSQLLKPAAPDSSCISGRAPLVGPVFTGSVHSLEEWFEDDKIPQRVVTRVVAGSVLGLSKERQSDVLRYQPFHWVRTQLPDLRPRIQDFLNATRGRSQSSFVNLTEDSTGFGASVRSGDDLTFPWQISRVRNAMPEAGAAPGTGLFSLPLQLRDLRRPHGALPTFAAEQTPAVEEVVLSQITARLDRATANYVFVTATDVLDLVFLSRLLRTANPGQRIFVNSPDMMLLRAHDVAPGTGILTAGTFPISNHLLLHDQPTKVFDSELSASIFTAASDAISVPDRKGRGLLKDRAQWLMALGQNGFWPVAMLSEGDCHHTRPDKPSLTWLFVFSLTFIASAVWLFLLLAARNYWLSGLADLRAQFRWPGWFQRSRTLTIVTLTMTVVYAVAAMPLWFPHRQSINLRWPVLFWLGLLLLTIASFIPWLRRGQRWRRHWVSGLFAVAPLLIVVLVALFWPRNDTYQLWRFFLVRSQDYLNGVAPLLPMILLLAGFVGCAWSSHIVTVISTERYVLPGAPARPPEFPRNHFQRRNAIAAAAISIPIFAVMYIPLHSLEPAVFDQIYMLIGAALLTWTLYSCFDLLDRWTRIKRYLDRLELHPIRSIFGELPLAKDTEPVWESHPRRRTFIFYGRAADCLTRLQIVGPWSPAIDRSIQAIRSFLDSKQGLLSEHQRHVEKTLRALARQFEQEIARPGGPWQAGSSELEKPPTQTLADRLKQEFLAMRLAAYLRSNFLLLRTRMTALIAGFVALTLSLNSYCFGPERIIQAFTIGLLLVLGASVAMVFAQFHSNPTLQRMSGAEAGKVDWSFWGKVASTAALPALSLLASYTPAIGKSLGAWLQPALEAVSR